MSERLLSVASTFALIPATRLLLERGSLLGLVYLASLCVAMLYHVSVEREFRRLDHVLAYSVIAANTFMVFAGRSALFASLGVAFVLLALVAYRDARRNPARYDRSHALWHVLCGAAGYMFALGYA